MTYVAHISFRSLHVRHSGQPSLANPLGARGTHSGPACSPVVVVANKRTLEELSVELHDSRIRATIGPL